MNFINYITNAIIPVIITLVIISGIKDKIKVFDIFLEGAKEGMEIVLGIFPTLIGLFLAIGVLRSSGLIDAIINLLAPITLSLHIPQEILPLVFLRPISRKCIYCNRYRYYEGIWC